VLRGPYLLVLRRTTQDRVGDERIVAIEVDFIEKLRQQFSGRPNERLAVFLFNAARTLAQNYELGFAYERAGRGDWP
jgi:hypothetical protein